jgi:hypothetical protein
LNINTLPWLSRKLDQDTARSRAQYSQGGGRGNSLRKNPSKGRRSRSLAKYLKTDDADALQEAYEAEIQALIPQKPYPTMKGIQIILRELGAKEAAARAAA